MSGPDAGHVPARRFCVHCGTPDVGAAFCTGCGVAFADRLGAAAPPPVGAAPPHPGGRSGRSRALVAGAVVVAALVGGLGVYLALGDSSSEEAVALVSTPTPTPTPEPTTASPSPTPTPSPAPVVTGDGVLTVGSLLPRTGNLAFLGPPEFAGVELAVQEINAAGGVLGQPVTYAEGDSGDMQQGIAPATVDRLLARGVDVIVGAASSGVSLSVIDAITAAGVVQISPANTSTDFTDYDDDGLYFRTAPSDVLQGRILGETVLADGCTDVGILALQDPYGEDLAASVAQTVARAGALNPGVPVFYSPSASSFDAEAADLAAAGPDCVVLIGFQESGEVIRAMVRAGIGPQERQLYLVDGNLGNALGEELPAGLLRGVKGSLPGAEAPAEFRARLSRVDAGLTDFSYAAESYDAVVVAALAAVATGDDAGRAFAPGLPDITRTGTTCRSFVSCKELLDAGQDIDYDGVSGPIELSREGDPTTAVVGIYTYGGDNRLLAQVLYATGSL